MQPPENFKDFVMEEHELPSGRIAPERRYRLGLVTAAIGIWIVRQVLEDAVKDPEIDMKVKNYLFSEMSIYNDQGIPMRLFGEGKWLVPKLDLEYDTEAYHTLYKQAYKFNFDPFMRKIAKLAAEKAAQEKAEQEALLRSASNQ
jgi:hypothetical protein